MRTLKPQNPEREKQSRSAIEAAKRTLRIESDSVADLIDRIDDNFAAVVHHLDRCTGNVVVVGMGKSGLIGKKIAATFSSIGLPGIFLNAAEASHGDVGIVSKNDIIIIISNSGETEEIIKLLPTLNRLPCTLIAMTGNIQSTLAQRCDYILNVAVKEEACAIGLVPTASTTATLAMGDALAMAYLDIRGFKEEDFAVNHPGGSLGRRLLNTVADIMHFGDSLPKCHPQSGITDVIREMSVKRMGMTLVLDDKNHLLGIITDGDLRRLIERETDISKAVAKEFMSTNPKSISKEKLATKALGIMEQHAITSLVVTGDDKNIDGIIHLQDLLKAGIV
jgi:arabinose-5-phosphate isomerase